MHRWIMMSTVLGSTVRATRVCDISIRPVTIANLIHLMIYDHLRVKAFIKLSDMFAVACDVCLSV